MARRVSIPTPSTTFSSLLRLCIADAGKQLASLGRRGGGGGFFISHQLPVLRHFQDVKALTSDFLHPAAPLANDDAGPTSDPRIKGKNLNGLNEVFFCGGGRKSCECVVGIAPCWSLEKQVKIQVSPLQLPPPPWGIEVNHSTRDSEIGPRTAPVQSWRCSGAVQLEPEVSQFASTFSHPPHG